MTEPAHGGGVDGDSPGVGGRVGLLPCRNVSLSLFIRCRMGKMAAGATRTPRGAGASRISAQTWRQTGLSTARGITGYHKCKCRKTAELLGCSVFGARRQRSATRCDEDRREQARDRVLELATKPPFSIPPPSSPRLGSKYLTSRSPVCALCLKTPFSHAAVCQSLQTTQQARGFLSSRVC